MSSSAALHQPLAQPRPSLYFPYRVHEPAPTVPAHDVPVLVVGAGPIGLVTALGIAQQGVRCMLIESELQVSEGSRAIVFTRRSMEILQQVGAADAIAAHGLPWRFGNSFYLGQRVFRMEAPHSPNDRFAPMTNLQQQFVEQYLLDEVARQPLIEMRWGHKVMGVARNDARQGVTLEIATPNGNYAQPAAWAVAADGARSTLRTLCGGKLEGAAYEGRFVIADIRIDLPLPTERLAYFDPDWNRGNTVLMHRQPEGMWRIDYQLPADESPDEALAPASVKQRIDAQLAMIGHAGTPWRLDWCSVYSARALTLPDYVQGRIAFVGDAAHLLPIFGVRGANTGFQDAQNLAWKLGMTLRTERGGGGAGLMASYSTERVAAAREIIAEAGKSTRFMTPPSKGFRLLRDAVLSLSLTHEFVRPLYHWRTSRPHDYLDSPLNADDDDSSLFSAGPANGALPPNLLLGDGDHLLDHLGARFTLLVRDDADMAALEKIALPTLRLPDHAAERLGLQNKDAALLVRPDQHVCARWTSVAPQRLQAALAKATARASETEPC